jgi:hypothetical protein
LKLPKYNLLYYKALIDKCFVTFFSEHNDVFTNVDGIYIMADSFSKAKIKAEFKRYLQVELKQYVKPYSVLEPDYYMIIGACMPKDNLLLKFNNDKLPEKL